MCQGILPELAKTWILKLIVDAGYFKSKDDAYIFRMDAQYPGNQTGPLIEITVL